LVGGVFTLTLTLGERGLSIPKGGTNQIDTAFSTLLRLAVGLETGGTVSAVAEGLVIALTAAAERCHVSVDRVLVALGIDDLKFSLDQQRPVYSRCD